MSSSRNIIKSRYNKELSSYVSLLEAESAVALADVENAVEEEEQQKESLGMVLPEKKEENPYHETLLHLALEKAQHIIDGAEREAEETRLKAQKEGGKKGIGKVLRKERKRRKKKFLRNTRKSWNPFGRI